MGAHAEIQVALFGAGRIGNVHAFNIAAHPASTVKYVIDPMEETARRLADAVEAEIVDTETALDDADVGAIVICSATDTHADLIEAGLAANKAVFCEKPIDLNINRVRDVLATAEQSECPLLIGFNRRFDPSIASLKAQVAAGAIGNVELLTIISKDPSPPPQSYIKVSGGLFRDMTIHDFDMARFLLGEEPVTVTATASSLVSPEIAEAGDIDTAAITMQTESGQVAVITNSRRASFGYDQRIEVHGERGLLRVKNIESTGVVSETDSGIVHSTPLYFFLERFDQSYRSEWDHFMNVVAGEIPCVPTAWDGYRALVLAEAAYLSLESARTVKVSEIEA